MNSRSEREKILLYLAVTLSISYVYQGFIAANAPDPSSDRFTNLALILMYFPGVIALVFTGIFKEGFSHLGLKLKRPIYCLYSIVIPAIAIALFLTSIDMLGFGNQTVLLFQGTNIKFLDEKAIPFFIFIPLFLISFAANSCIAGIFSIGEELGWRGYLQKKMIREFGLLPGIFWLGLVWGYWHLPLVLMGTNFPEYPILGGLILMPLSTIGLSFIFAWLTLRAQNIWPAVLAHGAINTLLSDEIVSKIEVTSKLWLYIILVSLVSIAGIIAAIELRSDYKQGKLENLFIR
jgi:uncharacterized protein